MFDHNQLYWFQLSNINCLKHHQCLAKIYITLDSQLWKLSILNLKSINIYKLFNFQNLLLSIHRKNLFCKIIFKILNKFLNKEKNSKIILSNYLYHFSKTWHIRFNHTIRIINLHIINKHQKVNIKYIQSSHLHKIYITQFLNHYTFLKL